MDYALKKLKDNFLLANDLKLFSICMKQKNLKDFMIDLKDMIENVTPPRERS